MADAVAPEAGSSKPVPEGFTVRTEGRASILQQGNEAFFNPAQVVNRDLSIAVLKHFVALRAAELASGALKPKRGAAGGKNGPPARDGVRILEGLSATGLRAIRYAQEIEGVAEVVANDMDPRVVEALRRNVEHNGGAAAARVTPSVGDARVVMMAGPGAYDAVDLDPYGSPTQLLDSAVQAVAEGGLLLVTATDMAVLCGNNGEACYAKYGSYPLHRPYCHEMAVRILLASIETHAARHKRYIVPLISLSIDFYVRVFVRVYTSAAEVKNSALKLGYVYQSQGCDSFHWQRLGRRLTKGASVKYAPGSGPAVPQACPDTGAGWLMGGPFWAEPIHDMSAVRSVLDIIKSQAASFPAHKRVHSLLVAAGEELPDVPLYFNLHDLCKTLRCTAPRAEVLRSAIVNAGYRVSSTHACALGVKTDAPWSVIWDIMRCWIKDHPTKTPPPDSYLAKLLTKEPELKANFSRAQQAISKAKANKIARFLPNPEANWGPKPKHGRPLPPRLDTAGQQPEQQEEGEKEQQHAVQQPDGETEAMRD